MIDAYIVQDHTPEGYKLARALWDKGFKVSNVDESELMCDSPWQVADSYIITYVPKDTRLVNKILKYHTGAQVTLLTDDKKAARYAADNRVNWLPKSAWSVCDLAELLSQKSFIRNR